MTWLRCEGYLKSVDSITVGGRQCNLYAIGQVRRVKGGDESDGLHMPQVSASSDDIRGQDSAGLHQVQKAHGQDQGQDGITPPPLESGGDKTTSPSSEDR